MKQLNTRLTSEQAAKSAHDVQQVEAAGATTIFGSKYLIKNPQPDFPNGTGNAQGN